jgi:hypothetical protein|tara:strand:- start:51 stop:464 length:414 start_codon:yes stop_codon:yes gene_type:complete
MITKFLHVCTTTTKADNLDEGGSVVYPVSSIRSIGMGSMAVTGVISASETVYHIALDALKIGSGADGASNVAGDNVDVINVTMTTANNAKAHMQELIQKLNSSRKTEAGWINLYDGVNGTKLIADLASAAVLTNNNS